MELTFKCESPQLLPYLFLLAHQKQRSSFVNYEPLTFNAFNDGVTVPRGVELLGDQLLEQQDSGSTFVSTMKV